jgi:aspartyl-tRNA(Asn)/glutamyl-tRNA(Gln) amidotransferase subunit A
LPGADNGIPTICEAAARLADGRLTSTALTTLCLDRIEQYDGKLHSFITLAPERALEMAVRADREIRDGMRIGPLHGIPYAAKDVYATAGLKTTGGSRMFRDNIPDYDATAISRLNAAGAILLGKLATHELTYGGVDATLPWPPARNPWDFERDPGGSSSGGGAAVAAGLCLAALGTDTGGSIRVPAALSGIAGFKPTFGRVNRHGVMQNSLTLDHCGPMAWTVGDCAHVLQVISGYDINDPASSTHPVPDFAAGLSRDIKGVRIGVVSHFWKRDLPAEQAVRDGMTAVLEQLEELGAALREVELRPLAEYAEAKAIIQMPEIFSLYGADARDHSDLFGPKFRNRIAPGGEVTAANYLQAQRRRSELTRQMSEAMIDFDVLVTSGPYPAGKLADIAGETQLNKVEITVPFSMTGFPVISICSGFTSPGLPLSTQIIGRPFDEAAVLRVASAYEKATPWRYRRPLL